LNRTTLELKLGLSSAEVDAILIFESHHFGIETVKPLQSMQGQKPFESHHFGIETWS